MTIRRLYCLFRLWVWSLHYGPITYVDGDTYYE